MLVSQDLAVLVLICCVILGKHLIILELSLPNCVVTRNQMILKAPC